MINRLCIIGVGLIGGSIAKAARKQGLCREIMGVDADGENLSKALEMGVIDAGFGVEATGDASQGADWVVIATPVGALGRIFEELKPIWSEQAVYTDVGSTKHSVIEAARQVFGTVPANFVPGHPIAGAERSGVEAANCELYRGKRVILTPLPETAPDALRRIEHWWTAIGAKVSLMDPIHHDQVFAATSHLPHVLAYALVHMLGRKDEQQEIFQYAGAGFRDFTRIASSSPQMWRDVCLLNRGQILPLIEELQQELTVLSALMNEDSAERLGEYFTEARNARQRFLFQSTPASSAG
ncbi:MAG: prephenate dehydrogenase/arogenate dehydrogenase family protein [Methylococcaceae bacterium]|nr:prephenate dehydrogenase/arogenate dehydrogenase family protein [Methylococcaceae bacterium]